MRARWPPPTSLRLAGRLCPRPARGLGLIRNSPAGIDARLTRRQVDKNPGLAISSRSLFSAFWMRGFGADVPFMLADTMGQARALRSPGVVPCARLSDICA